MVVENNRTTTWKAGTMSRVLQAAAVCAWLCAPCAAQPPSIDVIKNKSAADLQSLLGQPTARTLQPNTTREAWRYDTPSGTLWVFLVADRSVLRPIDPSNTYRTTDYPSDTRELLKRARAAIEVGNLAEAAAILDHCAALKNWGRRCVSEQRKLRERILGDTQSKLSSLPSSDLHAKRTLLLLALRDYPDAPGLTVTRAEIETEIDHSNLAAFLWIVSERRAKALAADVDAARGLIETTNYSAALKRLGTWGNDQQAAMLATDAKERLLTRTSERVTRSTTLRNLAQLEEAALAVEETAPHIAANELRQWRDALGREATEAIRKTIGTPLKGNVGLFRLVYGVMTRIAPTVTAMVPVDSETIPGGVRPRMSLDISAESGCGLATHLPALIDEIHADSPSDVVWTPAGQADVALKVEFRCTVQTGTRRSPTHPRPT